MATVDNPRQVFEQTLPERIKSKPELVQKVNASYKFVVQGEQGGTWIVDLTKPGGEVAERDSEAACTITMSTADFVDLINGKLNPQMAFMMGKLKVAGDIGQALKLSALFA